MIVIDKEAVKQRSRRVLDPVIARLAAWGVSPMAVSSVSLLLSFVGAFAVADGNLFAGAMWLIVAGLGDVVDGSLARYSDRETTFGAFIDSTFDRIAELAYFGGLIVYYASHPQTTTGLMITILCVGLAASMLTSYTRARLEGLGYQCKVGLMERPERVVLMILGLLLGRHLLPFFLLILAIGATITVAQRMIYAYRVTRGS